VTRDVEVLLLLQALGIELYSGSGRSAAGRERAAPRPATSWTAETLSARKMAGSQDSIVYHTIDCSPK